MSPDPNPVFILLAIFVPFGVVTTILGIAAIYAYSRVVLRSREIVIHITGSEKRSVIERARDERYPVAAVLEQATTPVSVWWAP